MEKISEAVIARVNEEALAITGEAEEKAREEIGRARKRWEMKTGEEKARILESAEEEVARIHAKSSIEARQQISAQKASVITRIIDMAESRLSAFTADERCLSKLLAESLGGLGEEKARIYVSPKDVATVQKLLESDKELAGRIVEVRELNCLGGIVAEDIDGKLRIDNTYGTRLEMLLPQLLPEISKELF